MKNFRLKRNEDESGVSGVGYVAEGCEFRDGTCVMSWLTTHRSIGLYPNIRELTEIHGHGGKTTVEWVEESK